jgi:hypothetical protein
LPEGLPKTLQSARKSCLDAMARVSVDASPRQRAIDAEYLRALAALQPKAAVNAELAKQIAAEKEKVLANVSTTTVPAVGSKPNNERNAIVNGTFDVPDPGGQPAAWKPPEREGVSFKVIREGANSIVRVTVEKPSDNFMAIQIVAVPPRARMMTLRGRVRGKWTGRSTEDDNWGANISARFMGADDQLIGPWVINVGGREAGGWKSLSKSIPVESGAKRLRVQFGAQVVSGTFDFDDIEVEFR